MSCVRYLTVLAALPLIACAGGATDGIYYRSGEGYVTPDGLHRVEWEPFGITYVRPGASLGQYDAVLIDEVKVAYKTPPEPEGQPAVDGRSNYALPESAIESIKRYFRDQLVNELGGSESFSIADAPGPGALRISARIVNVEIDVPPARAQDPNERIYTTTSGQMTLVLDVRDSRSGEALVRVGEAKAIQMRDGGWYESDPVANSSSVRDILDGWASDLRRELEGFKALPVFPPAPSSPTPE